MIKVKERGNNKMKNPMMKAQLKEAINTDTSTTLMNMTSALRVMKPETVEEQNLLDSLLKAFYALENEVDKRN